MKKRKKPIFLGAVLVLLVVVVVAFNANTFASSQAADQPPKAADDKQQQAKADAQTPKDNLSPEQQVIDKEKAEKSKAPAKGILKKDDDADALPIHGKGHDAIAPDAPKIMAPPDFHAPKVDPEKGSINSQGQWYSKESGVK